jgi:site-specific recombinase XerD
LGLTFREIARERMAHKEGRLAPRSYATDVQRLKPLLAVLGKLQAASIGPADIDRALRAVTGGSSGKATANRYLALLSSIFSHAVRNDRLASNPCQRVERFKEPPGRVRYLNQHDDQEETRLRAQIRKRCPDFEADLDVALNTGMRRDEQWSLKRDWVDLERNILTVYGKGARRRYIPINSACHAALRKLMDRAGKGEYLCAQKKREGQRDWRDWFERSRDAAGVKDFRWHDLRHTFASRLAMAGVSLQTIQQLLGHATLAMTMRYAHLSPAHLLDAVNKLGVSDPQFGMFP